MAERYRYSKNKHKSSYLIFLQRSIRECTFRNAANLPTIIYTGGVYGPCSYKNISRTSRFAPSCGYEYQVPTILISVRYSVTQVNVKINILFKATRIYIYRKALTTELKFQP